MRWKKLEKQDYYNLIENGKALTRDKLGDKVISLSNGNIAKLFRVKTIFSSSFFRPYAKRFVRAVQLLKKKNIPTVQIIDTYYIPSFKRDLIVYKPLKGQSLRELIKNTKNSNKLVLDFASFFAHLHNTGIYFRSIHFNNVIVTPKGNFGLIDVTDLHYYYSLNRSQRIRNFKPILHYKEDIQAIASLSMEVFLDKYIETAHFGSKKAGLKFRDKVLLKWTESAV